MNTNTSADTTPTILSTKTLKSSLPPSSSSHHPDNDSNTVEPTTSLPALPEALYFSGTGASIISNSAARHHHRTSASAFQEVDLATLSTTSAHFSDPLADPSSYFDTPSTTSSITRRHSTSGVVLKSPTQSSTPYEFEMQRFNAYGGSDPTTVKVVTTITPASSSTASTSSKPAAAAAAAAAAPSSTTNSFFTGWMTVPPSLTGRPKLTPDQEDYIRREYERGPVPLMWAKKDDLENQATGSSSAPAAAPSTSTSWFANWGFRSSTATTAATAAAAATAQSPVTAPPRAASDSGRKEASQALQTSKHQQPYQISRQLAKDNFFFM
ncbi:hypothetical protein BGX33_004976 [Mortierella sp. NVP41]|nr:hypothetical protein BGX33_004976 [Mortierella sp. NVP41]